MSDLPAIPWEKIGKTEAKEKKQAGILVDLRRCIGCHACSVACKTEHKVPLGSFRTRVRYQELKSKQAIHFLPLLCMQCQDAPCLKACPTQAIQRQKDGTVAIDQQRCCGNQACIAACPYDAIYIHPDTQTADKCDFCQHRTQLGMEPACVDVCPTEALKYGDFAQKDDPISQEAQKHKATAFKEKAHTQPSVLYIGLKGEMEQENTGIQLRPGEDEIIYQQHKGEE